MSPNYKNTLNLPETKFPMKASLATREPLMLQKWQELKLYHKMRAKMQGAPKFIVFDGPIYANNKIHLGHALNKILKDIVVKSKRFSGFDCPFVPGWDCHGLPIEREVEKKVGKPGVKVSLTEFREKCRNYAMQQVTEQQQDFVRLGVLGDWENRYLTMDYKFEANIIRALGIIYQKGHVQAGVKPVHWCIDCKSSLAEAELEYQDKTSPSIYVKFAVAEPEKLAQIFGQDIKAADVVIWTTTPWTLDANQAVAVHREYSYALVEHNQEHLIVAEDLLPELAQKFLGEYKIIALALGKSLEHLKLNTPLEKRIVPCILGDNVTLETGTGLVHTAPAHGPDDYLLGIKYNLPIKHRVLDNGCFADEVAHVGGENVFKANSKIIEVLQQDKRLLFQENIEHSYPHCWRHKTPLIFRATPQIFISMDKEGLRKRALLAIKDVNWDPSWGHERMEKMQRNRPDWCISRQRAWSTPLPIFVHKKTGEFHPKTEEIIEKVAQAVEQNGIGIWDEMDRKDLLGANYADYERNINTLDVWFDSGVMHYCLQLAHADVNAPADLYLEGSDQYRGWFNSSLVTAVAMNDGMAPYKEILTHGFTVDENGRKMSKSLGNTIAPQQIIDTLGADILRLWVAAIDFRNDMALSDEILKRVSDVYRRIRNTARFLLANLAGFTPQHAVAYQDLLELDKWIIARTIKLQQEVVRDYEKYNFHNVYQKIHNFCAIELGGFYLDIIKDRQYTTQQDSIARRSAQTAMYEIITALVRLIAPILSFTAEEIWQHIPACDEESVFLTTWKQDFIFDANQHNLISDSDWEIIYEIRTKVNKELENLRAAKTLNSSLEACVALYLAPEYYEIVHKLGSELRFVLITSQAEIFPWAQVSQDATVISEGKLAVNITKSDAAKCVRCWHRQANVGENPQHPELCKRCVINVEGSGEVRQYA